MPSDLVCPCGCREFRGSQACRGTVAVVVTIHDGRPLFARNDTHDGEFSPEGLDFDDPEGPFVCVKCGKTAEA